MPRYIVEPFHDYVAAVLDRVERGELNRVMIFAPPQHGKEISHHVPVLTVGGWKTHGDLRPGDFVFGRLGVPVQVLAISEDTDSTFEVEFTDGAVIQCHANHEWIVYDRKSHRPVERIMETAEMLDAGIWLGPKGKRGGRARFQVDANTAIEFPEAELRIPPYVLGAWLGDGTAKGSRITLSPDDGGIADRIEELGYKKTALWVHPTTGCYNHSFKSLYGDLRDENLFNNKRIPEEYLCSSRRQRLELLAGLIDTDGYVYQKNGRITISSADPNLMEDIASLIRSLGWRATCSWFDPITSSSGIVGKKPVCQVSFNPTREIPTILERKRVRKISPQVRRRGIRDIRSIAPEPGRCIQVEGGTYLVGNTFVPTHNSELVSIRLPAYWLGRHPDDPVILTSYAATLAERNSRAVRQIVEGQAFRKLFPKVRTNPASRRVDHWEILGTRGRVLAAGVGGPITGYGARLAIIDDPVKNWEQAQSETYRTMLWDWYRTTFRTRVWEDGAIVIIMTRWHVDDLVAKIMEGHPERWAIIRIPAISEGESDPLGRPKGEPLCPIRYSGTALGEIKTEIGSYAWSAEYQGSPVPIEGNVAKHEWFPIIDSPPAVVKDRVRAWDLAASEKKAGKSDPDYTVGTLISLYQGIYYIENVIRCRLGPGAVEQLIKRTAQADGRETRIRLEQEPGSSGKFHADMLIKGLSAFDVVAKRSTGDKLTRAMPFLAQAEAGHVRVIRAPWNVEWLGEICAVPYAPHWDQWDSAGAAYAALQSGRYRGGSKKYA